MKKIIILLFVCVLFGFCSINTYALNSTGKNNIDKKSSLNYLKAEDNNIEDFAGATKLGVVRFIVVDIIKGKLIVSGSVKLYDDLDNEWPVENIQVFAKYGGCSFKAIERDGYTDSNGNYKIVIDLSFEYLMDLVNLVGNYRNNTKTYVETYIKTSNENFIIHGYKNSTYEFSLGKKYINLFSRPFIDGFSFKYNDSYPTNYRDLKDYETYEQAIKAVVVLQMLNIGQNYYEALNSNDTEEKYQLEVVYPGYYTQKTFYQPPYIITKPNGSKVYSDDDYIMIAPVHAFDWDVILHEVGHYIGFYKTDMIKNVCGEHSIVDNMGQNLSEEYDDIEKGTSLAWSEGFATYFSLAAQLYYNSDSTTIDHSYNPDFADNVFSEHYVDINGETQKVSINIFTYSGYTESDEFSIASVLLNLITDEEIGLSHEDIFNIVKNYETNNFYDFYNALYQEILSDESLTIAEKYQKISNIGYLLEKNNIVNTPTGNSRTSTNFMSRNLATTKLSFTHAKQVKQENEFIPELGEVFHYLYFTRCKIKFYDKDFNCIYVSDLISSNEETYNFSINAIAKKIGKGEPFYWCIETIRKYNTSSFYSSFYSSFVKCYFYEDLYKINNLNALNYSNINFDEEKYFVYDTKESANYIFSSNGNTDVNVTIYDFPNNASLCSLDSKPIDDDDSGKGLNFCYSKYIEANRLVFIKVGGFVNASGSFSVLVTKCNGELSLNNSYKTTISGKNEIWYKFTAPKTSDYTFYTTGSIDTYGELFYAPSSQSSITDRITYNDDSGLNSNFLFTYNLKKGTVVYIRVRGYNKNVSGTCNLNVVSTPIVDTLAKTYSGTIQDNGYAIYKFTAPSAGTYRFYTTGNIDTYMDLLSVPPIGRTALTGFLISNDDGGYRYNALITYKLSKNQSVYVRVRAYDTGSYGFVVVKN